MAPKKKAKFLLVESSLNSEFLEYKYPVMFL